MQNLKRTIALTLAVVVVALAVISLGGRRLAQFVWPPATMIEVYDANPTGPSFDHNAYDALLRRNVSAGGWVDYVSLQSQVPALDAYVASIAGAPFDALGRDEKLALLINAYNAFTLRLVLDYYPLQSILDIPAEKRWTERRWVVGGHVWSLDEIEHEQIRQHFREPRIHFALVCAAIGCPALRNEAYVAERLDRQLDEQMAYCHSHERWFRFDAAQRSVQLARLYDWYGGDFTAVSDSVLHYAARYAEPLAAALAAGVAPTTTFLDYDWTLNDIANASTGDEPRR